jgi:K+-sensing histidine kinase KdpD
MRVIPRLVRFFVGVFICVVFALIAGIVFQHHNVDRALPLFFILLVVPVTIKFGPAAAIVGTILAAAIFAIWVFPPLGSFGVVDSAARSNLAWMILGFASPKFFGFMEDENRVHPEALAGG